MSGISGVTNWSSLTADQIKEYEQEGYDVPDQYEEWAKNAKNGSETYAKAMSEQQIQGTTTAVDSNSATEIDDTAGNTNEAQELYDSMDGTVSLLQMADVFEKQCTKQGEKITYESGKIDVLMQQSDSVSGQAESSSSISLQEINLLQNELDITQAKAAEGEGEEQTASQAKTQEISSKINAVAQNATASASNSETTLDGIAQNLQESSEAVTNAEEYADKTLDIADQCYAKAGKNIKTQRLSNSTSTSATTEKESGFSASTKGAAIGALAGGAVGVGVAAAVAGASTVTVATALGGSLAVTSLSMGAAFGIVGIGVAAGFLLGGLLFGGSKKKKYLEAAQKDDKAGTTLNTNASALDAKTSQVAQKNGFAIKRVKQTTETAETAATRASDTAQQVSTTGTEETNDSSKTNSTDESKKKQESS